MPAAAAAAAAEKAEEEVVSNVMKSWSTIGMKSILKMINRIRKS